VIVDYRIYCTIYALCMLGYVAALPLIPLRQGRYFFPAIGTVLGVAGITATANLIDWIWS
jgi:hypothetical protein